MHRATGSGQPLTFFEDENEVRAREYLRYQRGGVESGKCNAGGDGGGVHTMPIALHSAVNEEIRRLAVPWSIMAVREGEIG